MRSFSFSYPGREGPNQDRVLVCEEDEAALIAIADGMGGKEAGDAAAEIAVDTLEYLYKEHSDFRLNHAFEIVKKNIEDYATTNGIAQMGTTLTACLVTDNVAHLTHVGDTRLYHLRGNGIIAVSKDQSERQQLIDDGVLSKRRAQKYHRKNVLLSALTNYTDYELYESHFSIHEKDRLVLLSDGVYSQITKTEFRYMSIKSSDVQVLVEEIESLFRMLQ